MIISSPILVLVNPTQVSAASINENSNRIDSSGYHSTPSIPAATAADSPLSSPTPMVPAATNQGNNGDFTTQAALSGLWARQTNNIVGSQSYYDVVFVTSTTGTIKFIDITFPAGTVIGASINLAEREGIGAGSAVKTSDTVIRYTVTSAVSVPAGTKIRLEFFNIVNPTAPSTGYKVTVTTRNAAGTPIDGPTLSNSLNIKQIGTSQIADGAVTTTKIADGAITRTKPAESFMKKVILLDNQGGFDRGWTPDGTDTFFRINGEDINADIMITMFVLDPVSINHFCDVSEVNGLTDTFDIACSNAPPEGAELHYLVQNVPAHIS